MQCKTAASTETPFYDFISQAAVVEQIKGSVINEPGYPSETAKAANYFVSRNLNSGHFVAKNHQYYSESLIRRFIIHNHAIIMGMQPRPIPNEQQIGHFVVLMGFEWQDKPQGNSPGHYTYLYYDPGQGKLNILYDKKYDELINYSQIYNNQLTKWGSTVAYSTAYVNDTISVS